MKQHALDNLRADLARSEARIAAHNAECERTSGHAVNPDNEIGGMRSRPRRAKGKLLDRWDRQAGEATTNAAHGRGTAPDLREADLREADLRGADLREADLLGADLRGADLREADLRGADLRGADMLGADLRRADLRGADLREADLLGADMRGADMLGADLHGANLCGANMSRADLPAGWAIRHWSGCGSARRMTTLAVWRAGDKVHHRIWCGCFTGDADAFAAAVERTHAANAVHLGDYRAIVADMRRILARESATGDESLRDAARAAARTASNAELERLAWAAHRGEPVDVAIPETAQAIVARVMSAEVQA